MEALKLFVLFKEDADFRGLEATIFEFGIPLKNQRLGPFPLFLSSPKIRATWIGALIGSQTTGFPVVFIAYQIFSSSGP